jgi:superfamily I DNA and/or RNA helicase
MQGQERNHVIISCVRVYQAGFTRDAQRMNVAMSRAKESLTVFGSRIIFDRDRKWSRFSQKAGKFTKTFVSFVSFFHLTLTECPSLFLYNN